MASPNDLVNDYINARLSRVPQTPYTQEQSERYSAEAEDGNNDEYSRKKREYDEEEPVPTREEYESNQRAAEREMEEYNSQRELDDLAESEPYNDDDNYLENSEFSGNYFEKPENEESSLGDRVRAKYNSFSEQISNRAGSVAGSFVSGFNKKMDSFERGDPLFSTKRPPAKGRSIRYISRPTRQNKNLSRPYVGGRFDDSFSLGASNTNPYYPVNAGRQSASAQPAMDMYLPSGANPYEGEFLGRKAFKREFSDERERYDPFGYGGLSGDGFDNTSPFGSSLMSFGGDNGIFGGMNAGIDTVFGNGAMFNAPRGKTGKMDILGDSGMFAIGDLVIPQASRKTTTTKRKSASKTAKKSSKKPTTKRKSARKATIRCFALP